MQTRDPGATATQLPETQPLRAQTIEAFVLEMPLEAAIQTPITRITSVPALLVCVRDSDGVEGWGEVWCNFPRFGLHHRARLLRELIAPLVLAQPAGSPRQHWEAIVARSRVLRLQAGEPGPVAAVIAGLDIALWDIAAQKAGQPLWRLLGGQTPTVPVYASLGWAQAALREIEPMREQGVRAFKVRSAGDTAAHLEVVRRARERMGDDGALMMDLNSSWTIEEALAGIGALAPAGLDWLEEPVPVDTPDADWQRLAGAAPMPLAGGENMIAPESFDACLALGALRVVQPDATKWGGISGTLGLASRIVAAGRRYCPHMFGGAIGVAASAHLLASANAPDGMLEWGTSHNPARDAMLPWRLRDGAIHLGESPGLGLDVDRSLLQRHAVALS